MPTLVAINGFGRIGRNTLRAIYENGRKDIKVVAINASGDIESNAHLIKYDTVHGRFNADVLVTNNNTLKINNDEVKVFSTRNPLELPWKDLKVDVLLECTGAFTTKDTASLHLQAGAKQVLISAPGKEVDATVVYGVNHNIIKPEDKIISNASCTTNCLAPIAKVLNDNFGIKSGLMTTIHAFTKDQVLLDAYHKDLRRARSAISSMIPTKTGAADALGLVLPELTGKLDGFAVRVPTANVSLVDLTINVEKDVSIEKVNTALKDASENSLHGVLEYCDEPLVSSDFNHTSASAIFDASQTKVIDNLVKVMAWYDNEWGYSNRMLDTALHMFNVCGK